MASIVTVAPRTFNSCNNTGMAVVSLEWSAVATCPSTTPRSVAQALTRWRASFPVVLSPDRRRVLPSIAIVWPSREPSTVCTNCRSTRVNCCGSSSANTRPKVSCDGIPFGNSRNFSNHFSLARPNNSTSTQPSHPAMKAHKAMTKISESLCCLRRFTLGSATLSKQTKAPLGMASDMILLREEWLASVRKQSFADPLSQTSEQRLQFPVIFLCDCPALPYRVTLYAFKKRTIEGCYRGTLSQRVVSFSQF